MIVLWLPPDNHMANSMCYKMPATATWPLQIWSQVTTSWPQNVCHFESLPLQHDHPTLIPQSPPVILVEIQRWLNHIKGSCLSTMWFRHCLDNPSPTQDTPPWMKQSPPQLYPKRLALHIKPFDLPIMPLLEWTTLKTLPKINPPQFYPKCRWEIPTYNGQTICPQSRKLKPHGGNMPVIPKNLEKTWSKHMFVYKMLLVIFETLPHSEVATLIPDYHGSHSCSYPKGWLYKKSSIQLCRPGIWFCHLGNPSPTPVFSP